MKIHSIRTLLFLTIAAALISGCASNSASQTTKPADANVGNNEKAQSTTTEAEKPAKQKAATRGQQNPAPNAAFNTYSDFVLEKITVAEKYAAHSGNKKAVAKIQAEMDHKVGSTIEPWQKNGVKTLVIKPHVNEIKFIGGKARFWAGALAGKSYVLMSVDFVDQKTGKVIASPEFYQHANAFGGAWSMGSTDNNMLIRIADLVNGYVQGNYSSAVGGPIGR